MQRLPNEILVGPIRRLLGASDCWEVAATCQRFWELFPPDGRRFGHAGPLGRTILAVQFADNDGGSAGVDRHLPRVNAPHTLRATTDEWMSHTSGAVFVLPCRYRTLRTCGPVQFAVDVQRWRPVVGLSFRLPHYNADVDLPTGVIERSVRLRWCTLDLSHWTSLQAEGLATLLTSLRTAAATTLEALWLDVCDTGISRSQLGTVLAESLGGDIIPFPALHSLTVRIGDDCGRSVWTVTDPVALRPLLWGKPALRWLHLEGLLTRTEVHFHTLCSLLCTLRRHHHDGLRDLWLDTRWCTMRPGCDRALAMLDSLTGLRRLRLTVPVEVSLLRALGRCLGRLEHLHLELYLPRPLRNLTDAEAAVIVPPLTDAIKNGLESLELAAPYHPSLVGLASSSLSATPITLRLRYIGAPFTVPLPWNAAEGVHGNTTVVVRCEGIDPTQLSIPVWFQWEPILL